MRLPAPRLRGAALAALLSGSALACQVLYGDFRIDESELGSGAAGSSACLNGATRCDGATLQICRPDRDGFEPLETCDGEELCNLASDSCRSCTPGEYQCNGEVLRRCSDAQIWEETSCATPALCSVSDDRRSGSCLTPMCERPGEYRCAGAELQRCAADRERWEPIELCATEALCDADAANAAAAGGFDVSCRGYACRPGEFFCEAGRLGSCNAARDGWDFTMTCDPPELCNVERGDCSPCTPDSVRCSGAELLRCSASGEWQQIDVCATSALCDAALGECLAPGCENAGRVRCNPDTLELQYCPSDLVEHQVIATCAAVVLCDAGERRCEPPLCRRGARRCSGARLEICSDDLSAWQGEMTCPSSASCDPVTGSCNGTCVEGGLRCNDRYLEICSDGSFARRERCATRELCDAAAGACRPPLCGAPLPEFQCQGQILQVCRAGRDRFVELETCGAGLTCDAAAGRCR